MGPASASFKGQYQSNLSNTKSYWRKTNEATSAAGTTSMSNTKKNF